MFDLYTENKLSEDDRLLREYLVVGDGKPNWEAALPILRRQAASAPGETRAARHVGAAFLIKMYEMEQGAPW